MPGFDFHEYMLEAADIAELDDGSTVVYPLGPLVGRGYRLDSVQADRFLDWRARELQDHAKHRWQTAVGMLTALFATLAIAQMLGAETAGAFVGAILAVATVGLSVVAMLTVLRFRRMFPTATPVADPQRLNRWALAYIAHPAYPLWKCASLAVLFGCGAVWLGQLLVAGLAGLTFVPPADLAVALFLLTALSVFAAFPGYLTLRHLVFRRRHGRAPAPEDSDSLA